MIDNHPSDITVILKNEDSRYRKKFLHYGNYIINPDDETIKEYIENAKSECKFTPDEIQIKIGMTL